jgi:NAD(P)-dependent dehydrogenase (short-subunit alcohol dehydrogenase family)
MGKLDGKVAVITAATSGMALATAKLFVQEGAYVFITGRRQEKLDEAVKAIGRNVTGVQGDAANLADLDRLYETVKKEKGYIDVLFASAGQGGLAMLGSVTEEQFDTTFGLNVRGTLFTVQKALPLFRDGGSIVMNGPIDTPALENAPPEMIEQFRSMIPRKELGRPEEIAAAVLFLASDDSSFVNGSELSVDGGLAQI